MRTLPDQELLRAGWERNVETDEYRPSSEAPWISHEAARALALGSPELPAEPHIPEAPIDVTIVAILTDILEELREINRKLGGRVVT